MTDLEMDLITAKAEVMTLQNTVRKQEDLIANQMTHIASLQTIIEDMRKQQSRKCSFGTGVTFRPDGINELDPCRYELVEQYKNVTVAVLRCTKCGHTEIMWQRQENTEDGDLDGK